MHIDPLERRRLFAVSVIEGYPGFYEVHGDDTDNVIEISVSMANWSFTLNGVTYPNAEHILVRGYGGNDHISVIADDPLDGFMGASVDGGDGDDIIYMNFGIGAYGGSGNDRMYIAGECMAVSVFGDEGDDFIDCSGNNYHLFISGGDGNDTIFGTNYNDIIYGDAGTDEIHGLSGRDEIYTGGGGDYVDGGAGDDIVYRYGDTGVNYSVELIV
jgi:Ca2+-binding RTX toxin-like protein